MIRPHTPGRLPGALVALGAATSVALTLSVPATAEPTDTPDTHIPESVTTWTGQNKAANGAAMANTVCDYNGDGQGDVVASDWMWRRTGAGKIGTAYVIASGQQDYVGGDIDAAGSNAVRFEGGFDSKLAGATVTCAGDTNGDGLDDIAMSDYMGNQLHILYGERTPETRSVQYLGEHGFQVNGLADGRTSNSSAGIGDLNGDGFDDIAVVTKNSGAQSSGRIDIVTGADDIASVQLPEATDAAHDRILSTIVGESAGNYLSNVAPAGDVNGDGHQDLLISGYTAVSDHHSEGTTAAGMAWVVYGQEQGLPRTIDLADIDSHGFEIVGPDRSKDRLGISLAAAGDLNADGFDDLLLGADSTGTTAGAGVVVLGSDSNATVHTDPDSTESPAVYEESDGETVQRGWWIDGVDTGDHTGYSVAVRPADANNKALLVLGAYDAGDAGAVHVVDAAALNSEASLITVTELVDAGLAHTIEGTESGQRFGRSVAAVGDMDGNGSADLVFGGDAVNTSRGVISLAFMPESVPTIPETPETPTTPEPSETTSPKPTTTTPVPEPADPSESEEPEEPEDSNENSNPGLSSMFSGIFSFLRDFIENLLNTLFGKDNG